MIGQAIILPFRTLSLTLMLESCSCPHGSNYVSTTLTAEIKEGYHFLVTLSRTTRILFELITPNCLTIAINITLNGVEPGFWQNLLSHISQIRRVFTGADQRIGTVDCSESS